MARLAIITYPLFSDADRTSIQSVRAHHDPQFSLLDPHFTLVFPVEAPLADVLAQAESAAGATRAFPFTLRTARAVRDASGAGGHVFLVPEQGTQEVVVLHAALYSGALSWAHREDIPYVPHITVGAYADFDRCEALAHELEDGQINMSGRVDRVSVVEIGSSVETIAAFRLGGTISDPVA